MESRVAAAVEKKRNGYNCAQAIACTYCDLAGMDEETMYQMTQAFGAGFGNMQGTCGAISGACAILGLINSKQGHNKGKTMQDTRQIMNEFYDRNHSVICKELKGIETGTLLRGCDDCVKDAAEFLEKVLGEA